MTFAGTETDACVLSGFTIRNASISTGAGFGVRGNGTRATIQNNVIKGNGGRGLHLCHGPIQNNTITGNRGGGLHECNGMMQNNTITGNKRRGLWGCHGTIQNNTIIGNSVREGYAGGGLCYCLGVIQNNTITGNLASYGGALADCDGTIRNNAITGNSARRHGGGIHGCDGTIQNNTIVDNTATESGGGLSECSSTIRNCIIWGNTAPSDPQLCGSSIPTYSCVQDWTEGGEGNIALNPGFMDSDGPDNDPRTFEDNNYRLLPDSPCIDAGLNDDWMWTAFDVDRNPRIWDGDFDGVGVVDIGAYEYRFLLRITEVKASGDEIRLTWNSRPGDTYVIRACPDLGTWPWIAGVTVPSQGTSTIWADPVLPANRQMFYRIELK